MSMSNTLVCLPQTGTELKHSLLPGASWFWILFKQRERIKVVLPRNCVHCSLHCVHSSWAYVSSHWPEQALVLLEWQGRGGCELMLCWPLWQWPHLTKLWRGAWNCPLEMSRLWPCKIPFTVCVVGLNGVLGCRSRALFYPWWNLQCFYLQRGNKE